MKAQGQGVVNDIRLMLAIITQRITDLRDSDLRALRRRLSGIVISDPKETTTIEDVFVRLGKMRHLFSGEEWDSLVECKARIHKTAHPEEDGG
jgi:hypothetical protein